MHTSWIETDRLHKRAHPKTTSRLSSLIHVADLPLFQRSGNMLGLLKLERVVAILPRDQIESPEFSLNNYITKINTSRTTPFTHLLQNPSSLNVTRFILSNPPNLTVEYLTNSCGLSPQSAHNASKHIHIKSTTRPDSVLSLFNSHGFTKTQISRIVTLRPSVLLANPDKSLKPKLEYLCNVGFAGPDLTKIVSANPSILNRSLKNTIIPSINYCWGLVGTVDGLANVLIRSRWGYQKAEHIIGPNIAVLRGHGVPQSNISKMLTLSPQSLFRSTDLIKKRVLQLVRIGFCPSSMLFLHGLRALNEVNNVKWEEKMAVYKSFGWSEDEVLSVFKKQPCIMSASVTRITLSLNFFLNDFKWTREDIARHPIVILYSLEKRVIPRCRVLQILLSKNLTKKCCIGHALSVAENMFLKKFVSKYADEVPDLLKVYQSGISTQGLLLDGKLGA